MPVDDITNNVVEDIVKDLYKGDGAALIDNLLLEDGFNFLLEDGSFIKLES